MNILTETTILPSFVNKLNLKNYLINTQYINSTFHYLTLLEIVCVKKEGFFGNFLCKCGKTKVLKIRQVVRKTIKSCGCYRLERLKEEAKHGMYGTPIYSRWQSIKSRCNDPTQISYPIYGGKGISYCKEWEEFINFYNDMKEGFSPELEIDRIDVNKNYYKENCRWITHEENNYNKTLQSNNTSGKTGVNFSKTFNKWRAYIEYNRKRIELGYFIEKEDAIQARLKAELQYYGYYRGN